MPNSARRTQRRRPSPPAQIVILVFGLGLAVATVLLRLPIAAKGSQSATWLQSLFTAASAIFVTGLQVDTPDWTPFGNAVILAGIQVGGFGIMTLSSVLALLVSHRLGLRNRILAQTETAGFGLGDVRRVVLVVLVTSLAIETVGAVVLSLRFALAHDMGIGSAVWNGVFTSVSSFNQAGLVLSKNSLVPYVGDAWICLTVSVAAILGGFGFPVLLEIGREGRRVGWHPREIFGGRRTWTLHTRITVAGTLLLLVVGFVTLAAAEWSNSKTLAPLSWPHKLLAAFFMSAQSRSTGFNSVDIGGMTDEGWLATDALMFIGGGSASTAGGIKVTTFFVLLFAIIAEARGDAHVQVFRRTIPEQTLRIAVSVALLGVAWVFAGTLLLLALSNQPLDKVLFESISAFSTTGLSAGITADLPKPAQAVLVLLMFVGRVGTVTTASALALRERRQLYRYPAERTLIG
ncbi:Trk-type K+ transport system membrane component [Motilibacter peucedani]|uniref:Trk-type K+ transport system membrane component n=1 Tax=Motilibacter peucedani TaxID=598650 RepID=A0A420XRQ5_9ACTN|nr:potassium transporter TrkG [Motilibacter peucedani]RKS77487.1 Trk-type K+ transport system membrane component [Motilibacter peucedani]